MFGAQNFTALIRELESELDLKRERLAVEAAGKQAAVLTPAGVEPVHVAREDGWRLRVLDMARRHILSPHEFIDWAKRDRHWSFTLAEVMRESAANPAELAARLLLAIAAELEEERESRAPALDAVDAADAADAREAAEAAAYAD